MRHANPFRTTVDLGMILAFTLTALLGLSSATPTAVAGAHSLAPTGPARPDSRGQGRGRLRTGSADRARRSRSEARFGSAA